MTAATQKTTTMIKKRGNSAQVTLAQPVLDASGLKLDDKVVVTARDGAVEVRKADSLYVRCLEIYEEAERRYGRALDRLGR